MNRIRAVVVDPGIPERLVLQEVEEKTPGPSDAMIKVAAISLNRGEVRRSRSAEAGWRPGWDLAGTVEEAAADGSGPPEGSRVVGFLPSGAWAERVPVPTHSLAELPAAVSFAQASTLPVAGLTALYALERGGSLLGRTVLITGASGGVGHLACQMARLAGARVVGSVRQPGGEGLVRQAGAHEVVVGEDLSPAGQFGPYHLILESVGGSSLTTALTLLAPEGICVLFGTSGSGQVTFDASRFYPIGAATLYGFILFHEVKYKPASDGLARLVEMVAAGLLKPHIEVEASWTEIADVANQLMDRRYTGKAVLHL